MRVVSTLFIAAPPETRTISPHQALRASFPLRGKPCIEPRSEQLLRSVQDPSADARDDKGIMPEGLSVLYKIPRLTLGMTKRAYEILRRFAPQDDRMERRAALRLLGITGKHFSIHPKFYILHSTFYTCRSCGARGEKKDAPSSVGFADTPRGKEIE